MAVLNFIQLVISWSNENLDIWGRKHVAGGSGYTPGGAATPSESPSGWPRREAHGRDLQKLTMVTSPSRHSSLLHKHPPLLVDKEAGTEAQGMGSGIHGDRYQWLQQPSGWGKVHCPCSGALGRDVRGTQGLDVSEDRLSCSGKTPSGSPDGSGKGKELSRVAPYLA